MRRVARLRGFFSGNISILNRFLRVFGFDTVFGRATGLCAFRGFVRGFVRV